MSPSPAAWMLWLRTLADSDCNIDWGFSKPPWPWPWPWERADRLRDGWIWMARNLLAWERTERDFFISISVSTCPASATTGCSSSTSTSTPVAVVVVDADAARDGLRKRPMPPSLAVALVPLEMLVLDDTRSSSGSDVVEVEGGSGLTSETTRVIGQQCIWNNNPEGESSSLDGWEFIMTVFLVDCWWLIVVRLFVFVFVSSSASGIELLLFWKWNTMNIYWIIVMVVATISWCWSVRKFYWRWYDIDRES